TDYERRQRCQDLASFTESLTYPARAPLQTRRRYLGDPCLLASASTSFLPQPTERAEPLNHQPTLPEVRLCCRLAP
ncbi:hypothetical protein KUCAC02_029120, partial [Chaenocephalus aceratus]